WVMLLGGVVRFRQPVKVATFSRVFCLATWHLPGFTGAGVPSTMVLHGEHTFASPGTMRPGNNRNSFQKRFAPRSGQRANRSADFACVVSPADATRQAIGANHESPDGPHVTRPARKHGAQDRLLARGARRALLRFQGVWGRNHTLLPEGRSSPARSQE